MWGVFKSPRCVCYHLYFNPIKKTALKALIFFKKLIFAFFNPNIVKWKKTFPKHRLALVHWSAHIWSKIHCNIISAWLEKWNWKVATYNRFSVCALSLWRPKKPKTDTLTNSEDPDEMPHYAAFHQGLHCLLSQNPSSENDIYIFNYNLLTHQNIKLLFIGNSKSTKRVRVACLSVCLSVSLSHTHTHTHTHTHKRTHTRARERAQARPHIGSNNKQWPNINITPLNGQRM